MTVQCARQVHAACVLNSALNTKEMDLCKNTTWMRLM